jgi:GH25 family lysozyme M1 (1,4-beta-N-acetylmuramidase)
VSHWQGDVDWQTLKAAHGITFGGCKATEGLSFTDDKFPQNWARLAGAGLVRMAYHYGHPANDPEDEADHFLAYAVIPATKLDTDLYVLDLETGDGRTQAQVNAWAKAWAARISSVTGRRPVLYCGRAYQENQTGIGLNGPYGAWWYPRYPSAYANAAVWPEAFTPVLPDPNAWGGPPDFWQFTQSFVSGQGSMDADLFDGTLEELKAYNQT